MPASKKQITDHFCVVTVNKTVLWNRTEDEVWMLNPPRRLILSEKCLPELDGMIESQSDLRNSAKLKPLNASKNLHHTKILVERFRERGIGDLLFMTGPLAYIQAVSGGTAKVYPYALVDRGPVYNNNPALAVKSHLAGPVYYDELDLYDQHWFCDVATEYDEEPDQMNVYDALFRQIGVDPAAVDPKYKRPYATLINKDYENMDVVLRYLYGQRKLDLRALPYFCVFPTSNSSLRAMPHRLWLDVIRELAARAPVLVLGKHHSGKIPDDDMSFGEFQNALEGLGPNVFNLISNTLPVRTAMALVSRSTCVVCLDSGPLYIAQAMRVPAISVWGTHHPGVRLGYDKDYMDLAVWKKQACPYSPCFAYAEFPKSKCPNGNQQLTCAPLAAVKVEDIINKVDQVGQVDPGKRFIQASRYLAGKP